MITNKTARDLIIAKKLFPGGGSVIETDTATGSVANFETNMIAPIVKGICEINPKQEGTGDPSPSNPRPISGTSVLDIYHSGADTSNPTIYSIALGQTVYGGSADVVGGTGTSDRGFILINDSSYFAKLTSRIYRIERSKVPDGLWASDNINKLNCEAFKPQVTDQQLDIIYTTTNGFIIRTSTAYETANELLEAVGSFGISYPLATPTPFTFTGEEINSLLGENNIWHDGNGDISVTYKKKVPGPGGIDKRQFLPLIYGKKFKYNERS